MIEQIKELKDLYESGQIGMTELAEGVLKIIEQG